MIMLSVEFWIFSNYPLISDFSQKFYCIRKKSRLNLCGGIVLKEVFSILKYLWNYYYFSQDNV